MYSNRFAHIVSFEMAKAASRYSAILLTMGRTCTLVNFCAKIVERIRHVYIVIVNCMARLLHTAISTSCNASNNGN